MPNRISRGGAGFPFAPPFSTLFFLSQSIRNLGTPNLATFFRIEPFFFTVFDWLAVHGP